MFPETELKTEDFRGRKTLILGEVKSGKTALLGRILAMFMAEDPTGLVVMDLAPPAIRGIGGKLSLPPGKAPRVFSPALTAPRLTGRNPDEVRELAEENARVIGRELASYLARPGHCLFINDVSMYLQAREPARLLRVIDVTRTVVMNGYFGHSLGGGELGDHERARMEVLRSHCRQVINL
jgi:hypothetical protein